MPRWAWFLPLGVLVIGGGLLGFRYGWIVANMTETDAIEAYAARWMAQTGAPAADCTGVPGRDVWLVIRCGTGQDRVIYRVNRFGGLVPGTVRDTATILEPGT